MPKNLFSRSALRSLSHSSFGWLGGLGVRGGRFWRCLTRLYLGDGSWEITVNRQSNEKVSARVESKMRKRERSAFVRGTT